jgi:hypothetical protein
VLARFGTDPIPQDCYHILSKKPKSDGASTHQVETKYTEELMISLGEKDEGLRYRIAGLTFEARYHSNCLRKCKRDTRCFMALIRELETGFSMGISSH